MTPDEIYRQSFADIKRLTGITGDSLPDKIRRRMIHACGDTDIADDIIISGDLQPALDRLQQPCKIITDSALCRAALLQKQIPQHTEIICAITQVGDTIPPSAIIPTRSALSMEAVRHDIANNIVIIGNAPTALQRLLNGIESGWESPALLIAIPVGFVGAVESKQTLCDSKPHFPFITLKGRKGGSAIAAASMNAILLHHWQKGEGELA